MSSFDRERIGGVVRREVANLILECDSISRGKGNVESFDSIVGTVKERLAMRHVGISKAMFLMPGFPSVSKVVRDFLDANSIHPGEWLTDSGRAACVAARDAWLERFSRGGLSFSLLAGLVELSASSPSGRVVSGACGFGAPEMRLSSRFRYPEYAESQIFDSEWNAGCFVALSPAEIQSAIGEFAKMAASDSVSALFSQNWLDMFQVNVDYRRAKEEIVTGTEGEERRDLTTALECDMFESFPACDLERCVTAVLESDLPSVRDTLKAILRDGEKKILYGIQIRGKRGLADVYEFAEFGSLSVGRKLSVIATDSIRPEVVREAVLCGLNIRGVNGAPRLDSDEPGCVRMAS